MSKNYLLNIALAAGVLALPYPKNVESRTLNVAYEQVSHQRPLALVTQIPSPLQNKTFKSLERRVAEFDFADIVGHSVDPNMDYTFIAYDFGKNAKEKGKLHSKKEIIKFLDSKDYTVLKIYKRDKGALHQNWTIKIERLLGRMRMTYDTLQWGEHGKIRFIFDSVPDNGSGSVIEIWNTLYYYISSFKQ